MKIDFNTLNLGQKLFGATKKETILIQKQNCNNLLKFYKIAKKAVKILNKKNLFNGIFFVDGLKNKANNNDLMFIDLYIGVDNDEDIYCS